MRFKKKALVAFVFLGVPARIAVTVIGLAAAGTRYLTK